MTWCWCLSRRAAGGDDPGPGGHDPSSDVLFYGNTADRSRPLIGAFGQRVLFGFPAVGGTPDGPVIKYVLIRQQRITLDKPGEAISARVQRLRGVFRGTGFSTVITANIDGWLGHAAFTVPIAFAMYRDGTDAARLARDPDTLRLLVPATRQAFQALHAAGAAEIPANLNLLYRRMPEAFAVRYLRRVRPGSAENCGSPHTAGPRPKKAPHSARTCWMPCTLPGVRRPPSMSCQRQRRQAGRPRDARGHRRPRRQ